METVADYVLHDHHQKLTAPNGRWIKTSYGTPGLSRFYNTPLLTATLGTGKGFLASKISHQCFEEDDAFSNLNGWLIPSYWGEDTLQLLPKGSWLEDAANSIWTQAENLIHTENSMMNYPCIPDINGALRQINDEQLIYINTFLLTDTSHTFSCFALSSEEIDEGNDRLAGIAHENDNSWIIGQRNNFDIDPPEGDWFKSADEEFFTFRFFNKNIIVARLHIENGYRTAISCYSDGDELTNEHGYFRFSQIGPITDKEIPEGRWRDTAYNIVWASADQLLNPGKVRTYRGHWKEFDTPGMIYMSYFPDHGSLNTKNCFIHPSEEPG